MSEVKWIKLYTDIFDNRKIRQIESLPDGDGMLVIWLKLLCLAGSINDGGLVYITRDIPYNEQTLATEFGRPLPLVKMALETFKQFGMIEIVNNFLLLPNWEKYQNEEKLEHIRQQNRDRVAAYRERQRCNVTVTLPVTQCNAIDKDKDKDKDISICAQWFDAFWASYPKKKSKADAEKAFRKKVKDEDTYNKIMQVLEVAKKSYEWTKDDGQYIPYPATWLNGERWNEDYSVRGPRNQFAKFSESETDYSALESMLYQ